MVDDGAAKEECVGFEFRDEEMCTAELSELAPWVEAKGLTYVVGLD